MIRIEVNRGARHCDGMTRREALRIGALGLGGLTLPRLLQLQAQASVTNPNLPARAQSVIILVLFGGPSHLDTWDLKPNAPEVIRGTFQPVRTNVTGIQITEHMRRMAQVMDHCAIIRSMRHGNGNHPAAAYWMMVGSPMTRLA